MATSIAVQQEALPQTLPDCNGELLMDALYPRGLDWQADFAQWKQFTERVRRSTYAIVASLDTEARKAARAAGLDAQMPYLHAHNAIASFEHGKPWQEVDYSLARRVLWLEQRQFQASRLAERIICRAYNRFSKAYGCAQYQVRP